MQGRQTVKDVENGIVIDNNKPEPVRILIRHGLKPWFTMATKSTPPVAVAIKPATKATPTPTAPISKLPTPATKQPIAKVTMLIAHGKNPSLSYQPFAMVFSPEIKQHMLKNHASQMRAVNLSNWLTVQTKAVEQKQTANYSNWMPSLSNIATVLDLVAQITEDPKLEIISVGLEITENMVEDTHSSNPIEKISCAAFKSAATIATTILGVEITAAASVGAAAATVEIAGLGAVPVLYIGTRATLSAQQMIGKLAERSCHATFQSFSRSLPSISTTNKTLQPALKPPAPKPPATPLPKAQPPVTTAATHFKRGQVFFNEKDYSKAITEYTCSINLDPKTVWNYFHRAIAYHKLHYYEKAIDDLDLFIKKTGNETAFDIRADIITDMELAAGETWWKSPEGQAEVRRQKAKELTCAQYRANCHPIVCQPQVPVVQLGFHSAQALANRATQNKILAQSMAADLQTSINRSTQSMNNLSAKFKAHAASQQTGYNKINTKPRSSVSDSGFFSSSANSSTPTPPSQRTGELRIDIGGPDDGKCTYNGKVCGAEYNAFRGQVAGWFK